MEDDIIGRIYEYFLNKFAPAVASDDGVFFTPKSLVHMIINIIESAKIYLSPEVEVVKSRSTVQPKHRSKAIKEHCAC